MKSNAQDLQLQFLLEQNERLRAELAELKGLAGTASEFVRPKTNNSGHSFAFLPHGGQSGELIRSLDWSQHPLGPSENWPLSLRIMLGVILGSKHPMFLFWGEEHYCFYNDGYLPSFGKGKHPSAMGRRGKECWPEIWADIFPQIETVMKEGKSTWHEDQFLPIFRNGRLEDVYWTYSYSPLFDEAAKIVGVVVTCNETTKKVLSLKALKESETRYRESQEELHNFFMQAPVPMVILEGPNHRVTLANPLYEKLAGRKVLGKTIAEAFTPSEVETFIPLLDSVYQSGNPYIGKEMPIKLEGTQGCSQTLRLDFGYYPFKNSDGTIKGVFALVHDVTEKVEQRLNERAIAEQLRLVADFSPALISYVDKNEKYQFMNRRYGEWFGADSRDGLGKSKIEVVGPVAYSKAKPQIDKALKGEHVHFENELVLPDGATKYLDMQFVPFHTSPGETNGFIILGYDITDRRYAEDELKRTADLLSAILTQSQDLIYLKDRNSRMLYCNPATLKFTGLSEEQLYGKTDIEFLGPGKEGEEILRTDERIMSTGVGEMAEEWVTSKEGIRRLYMSEKQPHRDLDGKVIGLIGISRDITDLKNIQSSLEDNKSKLRASVQQLENERELRERFVATLSHDLRTPLMVAKMTAQMMARNPKTISANQKLTGRIAVSLDRLDNMIRDLLDANRIRAGEKLPLELEECQMSQVIASTLEELRTVQGERFEVCGDLEFSGYWSKGGLRRILENLCSNAVKYGAKETPVRITVTLVEGGYVTLSVHNQGAPIPKAEQATLFEPFKRAASAETEGQKGWGLGLTLVRGIAEAHGGKISLRSTADEGTIFSVTLPVDSRPKIQNQNESAA
jgi:PAS domain S-box-containing protein